MSAAKIKNSQNTKPVELYKIFYLTHTSIIILFVSSIINNILWSCYIHVIDDSFNMWLRVRYITNLGWYVRNRQVYYFITAQ